ncbi:MAG: 50S ribosomal protein L5 [Deltaproteobacteria bacterium]|nr:50S ribosomal protein L5 [Deltaproteobacteria bacterium]
MARLADFYQTELRPKLQKELGLPNVMQVPKVVKVVVNMGLGEAIQNVKILESAADEIARITGQKAVITKAKRSIATYKLREGMPIGCMVTLRRERAYEFLDRLINIALARVRDFKGISPKAFDGRGNYTFGVREQIIFPEIDLEKIDKVKGLNISIVTSAKNDEEGRALLTGLGMPFRK